MKSLRSAEGLVRQVVGMTLRALQTYRRAAGIALLMMAGFQVWIARAIYAQHPVLATVEAVMAAILVLGVTLVW